MVAVSLKNWKYSTLTERERLKLIRSGNDDVYNAEKEKNKTLRQQQNELGIDTTKLDLWDDAIDTAYNNIKNPRKVNKNLPKFMSPSKSRPYVKLNRAIENAEKKAKQGREKAVQIAIESTRNLEEYLANNGLSKEGSYAKKEFERISSTLYNTVKGLNDEYKLSVARAKEDFLGLK